MAASPQQIRSLQSGPHEKPYTVSTRVWSVKAHHTRQGTAAIQMHIASLLGAGVTR